MDFNSRRGERDLVLHLDIFSNALLFAIEVGGQREDDDVPGFKDKRKHVKRYSLIDKEGILSSVLSGVNRKRRKKSLGNGPLQASGFFGPYG